MNILFSKITKRKKIEFDDPKSSATALVKSVLSIEQLSTKVPAICVQTPIDKIVFAFKDESLCRESTRLRMLNVFLYSFRNIMKPCLIKYVNVLELRYFRQS